MRSRSSASWRIACGPPGPRPPRNDHRRSRDASAGAGGEARAAMPSSQHRARCRLTLASIGPAVLVYCADELRPRAAATMPAVPAGALFTDTICARIAGLPSATSKGRPGTGSPTPRTSGPPRGRHLDCADPLLTGLRGARMGRRQLRQPGRDRVQHRGGRAARRGGQPHPVSRAPRRCWVSRSPSG